MSGMVSARGRARREGSGAPLLREGLSCRAEIAPELGVGSQPPAAGLCLRTPSAAPGPVRFGAKHDTIREPPNQAEGDSRSRAPRLQAKR